MVIPRAVLERGDSGPGSARIGVDKIGPDSPDVQADGLMTFLGKATRRNGPDVSETPDAKLHNRPSWLQRIDRRGHALRERCSDPPDCSVRVPPSCVSTDYSIEGVF
jgi:hypothetical protein